MSTDKKPLVERSEAKSKPSPAQPLVERREAKSKPSPAQPPVERSEAKSKPSPAQPLVERREAKSKPSPAPAPPDNYGPVHVHVPTSVPKVLGAGVGRVVRTALAKPKPGSPPQAVLEYGPREIDRDGLAAYQRLIGHSVSDSVPTGWVHVMAFPLHLTLFARGDFPLPPLGMVHVHNTVTHLRAITADETLTFRCWAENLRPHKRGATIEIYATASINGEVVWHGVSTYLAKGGLAPKAATPRESEPIEIPENLPGHHLWRLPKGLGNVYAEVSGDNNPIHTTALAAKAFGFRGPIVHGMYSAARALAEVPHGEAFTWHVDFFSPVIPPAKVTLEFGPMPDGDTTIMKVASRSKTHLAAEVTPL